MQSLSGKKILLGITGSIAAYKSLQIVRDITAAGGEVQVVLTPAAHHFVPPLTLQVFSKKPVLTDLFASTTEVLHVTLATGFDLVVIAPATADFIAKMALGIGNDLLSNILLSTTTQVLLAPAMDLGMWDHPAVSANVALLKKRGCMILDPTSGPLASGLSGIGRMADEETIFNRINMLLAPIKPLDQEVVLVTAGPTQEAIDPVRFISNRSSGKMGYAIADLARQWGAKVILITGPTALPIPQGVRAIHVRSAAEMKVAVTEEAASATVVIMAAAVGDYTPVNLANQKLKRMTTALALKPTDDIIAGLAKKKGRLLVGFSAETENLYPNAWAKLKKKGLDLIVANDLTQEGAGFDVDTNIVLLIHSDGSQTTLPKMLKSEVARHILEEVTQLRRVKK